MENGEKSELGEDSFYGWVDGVLNSDRDSLHTRKKNRSDIGMENQFIRPHNKNFNASMDDHNKENSDIQVTEALKRINQIMKKII